MSYELVIEHRAEKDLKKLEHSLFYQRFVMTGVLKVGDYRVLYEIDNKNRVIKIMKVKHRREVNRNN